MHCAETENVHLDKCVLWFRCGQSLGRLFNDNNFSATDCCNLEFLGRGNGGKIKSSLSSGTVCGIYHGLFFFHDFQFLVSFHCIITAFYE